MMCNFTAKQPDGVHRVCARESGHAGGCVWVPPGMRDDGYNHDERMRAFDRSRLLTMLAAFAAGVLAAYFCGGCGRVDYQLEHDAGEQRALLVVAGESAAVELGTFDAPCDVVNVAGAGATFADQLDELAGGVAGVDASTPITIAWVHGETAATTLELATNYPRDLELFAYDVQTATGRDDLQWLVVLLRETDDAGARVSRATVRYGQQAFAMVDDAHRELVDTTELSGPLDDELARRCAP